MSNPKEIKTNVKTKIVNYSLIIGVPIGLMILWEILSRIGIINASILPAPSTIAKTFNNLIANGKLESNFIASMDRVVKGFIIGTVLGIVIGSLMGVFEKVNKSLSVIVGILRPIPMIGWVPLLILWMGIDEGSKITVIALGTFWSVLINTIDGIRNVDRKYIEVAYILEKNKFTTLIKVVIPSALPSILTGIRLGFGNAWKAVVAAEMIAATSGIGYLISYARELSQPDVMLVGLLTIGLMGLLIDFVIIKIQNRVLSWND